MWNEHCGAGREHRGGAGPGQGQGGERLLQHLSQQSLARPEHARTTTRWQHCTLYGISADVQVRDS